MINRSVRPHQFHVSNRRNGVATVTRVASNGWPPPSRTVPWRWPGLGPRGIGRPCIDSRGTPRPLRLPRRRPDRPRKCCRRRPVAMAFTTFGSRKGAVRDPPGAVDDVFSFFRECLVILGVLEQLLLQLTKGCALCRVGVACRMESLRSGEELIAALIDAAMFMVVLKK